MTSPRPPARDHSRPGRRRIAALLAAGLVGSLVVGLGGPAAASPSLVPDATAGTNGKVLAVAQGNGRIYVGGNFTWAGPSTGAGALVNDVDGHRAPVFPRVNGPVRVAVSDLRGGWLIAGDFTAVGNQLRAGVARISNTGSLHAWNPAPNGPVEALAIYKTGTGSYVVYLGGSFSSAGGASRQNIAAVDGVSGTALPFDPGANGPVTALALSSDNTRLFAGGSFSSVGGPGRSGLASVDASTGTTDSWDPEVDGPVKALAVSGDVVYAAGSFANAGGEAVPNLAAIDASSGAADPSFDPFPDGPVRAVLAAGGRVVAGGSFANAGGQPRANLVSLDPSTGDADLSFDPSPDGAVDTLATNANGTRIFAGGAFTEMGGQERARAPAFDLATGTVDGWDPSAEAEVRAVARSGAQLYVGGDFTQLNGAPRTNVAAIDAVTGDVDKAWRADTNGEVRGLAVSTDGGQLYIGGIFTQVGAESRKKIAAVDTTMGAPDPSWNPGADGAVRVIVTNDDRVYAGGGFTTMGGENVPRLAAIDATTGVVDATFDPAPDGTVRGMAITPDGSRLYVGGFFGSIAGVSRDGAASLIASSGTATSFDPLNVGSDVIAVGLSPDASAFYLSTKGNKTARYNPGSGSAQVWSIKSSGDVQAIAASATEVYVGGHFTKLNQSGGPRNKLGSLVASNGQNTDWNPKLNSFWGVWALVATPDSVLAGGEFTRVGGKPRPYFARFPGTP